MASAVGLAMNSPHTEERAVFTQLKPVRMSGGDSAEDSSVFEEVKPTVRISAEPLMVSALPSGAPASPGSLLPMINMGSCR